MELTNQHLQGGRSRSPREDLTCPSNTYMGVEQWLSSQSRRGKISRNSYWLSSLDNVPIWSIKYRYHVLLEAYEQPVRWGDDRMADRALPRPWVWQLVSSMLEPDASDGPAIAERPPRP
jgi:hypothetical protein